MKKHKILITGGAGYIGSHTTHVLKQRGFIPVVVDNLTSGNKSFLPDVPFYQSDISDEKALADIFSTHKISSVIHFAGLIEAGESMVRPHRFYTTNLVNTLHLLKAMRRHGVDKIVFSSSAAVYGSPKKVPIPEDAELAPVNVYGKTKLFVEHILSDHDNAYGMRHVNLRYFNASGAAFGIGEDHDPESHLIPIVLQAALGKRDRISVFGTDYDTPDGTCIRDYIHVVDLADAHVLALRHLISGGKSESYNVGTGKGFSVQEIIKTSRQITGRRIQVVLEERRPGDPAVLIADSSKIQKELRWKPKFGLNEIISSAWDWHSKS